MFCFRSNIHTPSRFPRTSTLDMHQQCSEVQSLEAATLKGKPWRARKEFDVLVWNIPSSGSRRLTMYFQQTHVSLTVSPKRGRQRSTFRRVDSKLLLLVCPAKRNLEWTSLDWKVTRPVQGQVDAPQGWTFTDAACLSRDYSRHLLPWCVGDVDKRE